MKPTAEQRHDSQINEVQEFCRRRFGNLADMKIITDTASGAKTSREGLDQVMKCGVGAWMWLHVSSSIDLGEVCPILPQSSRN